MSNATNDLTRWLNKHGLGQYALTFAENNIDCSLLPDLTEADLVSLGLSMGHRKVLLKAIDAEARRRDRPASPSAIFRVEAIASSEREAEHRHITVLFCDLVGSTQMSESMEPEELQILLTRYREACSAAIRRYGGWVARYMGDGVMAFFGWPDAHEGDAVRAVHAALEAISAITQIAGPAVSLAARVGISSGPVVVGSIGRADDTTSIDAVGETPNIAARLQTLATPNTILITESTRRLLAGAFDCQDLGRHELKGISRRLQVYRVLSANVLASRFDAAHTDSLTPLVGRSTELSMLLDRWHKSKEGDGQIVLLSGLPGVGKSRLIHELKSQIQDEPHFLLNHQCSPYHSQSAFFPIIEHIGRAAEIAPREADADKLAKLKAYLPDASAGAANPLPLIANLLSISTEDHKALAQLTPQQIKNRTVSVLVDMALAFASGRPTLCIFEDAHWIDPSTLEVLEHSMSRVDHARILLVVSYRPEFRPNWFNRANVTLHSLTRLSRSEVAGMVEAICFRERRLLQPVMNQIIEKADGLPLFIEELTNSVLASMRSRVESSPSLTILEPVALKVPETLYDALMERLDRFPQGRKLAQTAAVIGREFSYELLSLASRIVEDELQPALARLEGADIINRVGIAPHVLFAFKHALLRDAIYSSLLKGSRRQMHADIAAILEGHFSELVETQPELLAYHYGEAGNHELAVRFWQKSGQRALANSANVEAISHFRKSLEALAGCADTPERTAREIEIHLALGIPLIAVHGYAADETRDVFSRARALCVGLDNPDQYFQALFGLWGHSWMSGKTKEALGMANEFFVRAQTSTNVVPLMVAHRVMGSTLLPTGQFQRSRQHFEESIALSRKRGKQSLHSRYMVEPHAASLLLLSWDLWILGYPEQALRRVLEALDLARELAHPYSIAFANYMTSVVHLWRGEPAAALASAEVSLEISREQRFSLYALLSKLSRGCALGGHGNLESAGTEIKLGLDEMRSKGLGFMRPMMEAWLADILMQSGDYEAALSVAERSLAGISDSTGRSWEADSYRQRAAILQALDPNRAREVEINLEKAVDIARRQAARSFELRAATDLAMFWNSQGKRGEARDLIEPIYSWFSEGHDTQDLRRAREVRAAISNGVRSDDHA